MHFTRRTNLACVAVAVLLAVASAAPVKGCEHKAAETTVPDTVRAKTQTKEAAKAEAKAKGKAEDFKKTEKAEKVDAALSVLDGLVEKIEELRKTKLSAKAQVERKHEAHIPGQNSDELKPEDMEKAEVASENENSDSNAAKDSVSLSLSSLSSRLAEGQADFLTAEEREGLAAYVKAKGLINKSVRAAKPDADHDDLTMYTGKMEMTDFPRQPDREQLADTL